jgi:hypothetical protein
MELNVPERMMLMGILPSKGGFVTLQIVQEIRDVVNLTPAERKKAGLEELIDGTVKWDAKAATATVKDIPFTKAARTIIEQELKALNDKEELQMVQMSLYEKFMLAEKPKTRKKTKKKKSKKRGR